jgi:hypothetical protein
MMSEPPARRSRRLLLAWGLLVGLTVISLVAVLGFGQAEGGRVAAAVALAASYLKARAVLDHFMDLRRAGPGWRGVFSGLLLVLLGGLLAAALVVG